MCWSNVDVKDHFASNACKHDSYWNCIALYTHRSRVLTSKVMCCLTADWHQGARGLRVRSNTCELWLFGLYDYGPAGAELGTWLLCCGCCRGLCVHLFDRNPWVNQRAKRHSWVCLYTVFQWLSFSGIPSFCSLHLSCTFLCPQSLPIFPVPRNPFTHWSVRCTFPTPSCLQIHIRPAHPLPSPFSLFLFPTIPASLNAQLLPCPVLLPLCYLFASNHLCLIPMSSCYSCLPKETIFQSSSSDFLSCHRSPRVCLYILL